MIESVAELAQNGTATVVGIAGALAGGAILFRKYFSQWHSIGADMKTTEAHAASGEAMTLLYKTLTDEIGRLAMLNKTLSTEVEALSKEVQTLKLERAQDLTRAREENLLLRKENESLREQIAKFESKLKEFEEASYGNHANPGQ